MKIAMVLTVVPMLLASTAYAMGGFGGYGLGNVDIVGSDLKDINISSDSRFGDIGNHLDIVGSKLNDIKICSDDFDMGNAEIVGSSVSNVNILQVPHEKPGCYEREQHDDVPCYWDSACMRCPNEKPHLGVDAWYGCYWFNDQIYTPKWPY